MSNGFTRRKEQSKEDIRKSAWELFSQFGVEKVSIADIARKAGVSQATIYNNFSSKEALAREFVAAAIEQLVSRFQEVLTPKRPYEEKMGAFIQAIAAIMAQARPAEVEGAAFPASADLLQDPEIKKIRDTAQDRMANLLLGLVQEGKEQGQVNPELSAEALQIYFRAFMELFTDPRLQQKFFSDPQLVQNLGALMLFGLSGQKKAVGSNSV